MCGKANTSSASRAAFLTHLDELNGDGRLADTAASHHSQLVGLWTGRMTSAGRLVVSGHFI